MFKKEIILIACMSILLPASLNASTRKGKYFDRVIFVLFENESYSNVINQPFFKKLADSGAHFSNFMAETHPSQGNYVALTSGSTNGVTNDNPIDINALNVVDLLEEQRLTWKVYAEDFPGNCFTGKTSGGYARKHNPFISYLNIQKNSARCANIVNASQFDSDVKSGRLPNYVFYVPNNKNSGHDTSVAYADKWYAQKFTPYLNDARFMENTVLISTFDESGSSSSRNQTYTSIVGPAVKPGIVSIGLNHYSLLKLVEDNFDLKNLGKLDVTATAIANIW